MPKSQDTVRERPCVSANSCIVSIIAVVERRIYKTVCFGSNSAGSNGMGQAQSQSSGSGCDECLGGESNNGYSNGK